MLARLASSQVDVSLVDNPAFPPWNVPLVVVRNPWALLAGLRFYLVLRVLLMRYYTRGSQSESAAAPLACLSAREALSHAAWVRMDAAQFWASGIRSRSRRHSLVRT
jgi:hypothetical protein